MPCYILLSYIFMLILYFKSLEVTANKFNLRKNDVSMLEMEAKIVGGRPIALEVVPYSVQIFNLGSMCAGTVLNSWTVLTAAHCFDLNKDIEEMVVQIGSRYVYDFNAVQYYIAHLVIHSKYNQSGQFACDIAMVFMENPIEFNSKTQKAVLVTNDSWMTPDEKNFTVTGWGWTQYGGPVSKLGLMMTNLRFVTKQKCEELHQMKLSPDMFCLYGEGARDTCKGDSGGGVFWKGLIVGITSHGDGCAKKHKPSVYANVHHFRKWIKNEMFSYIKTYCRDPTSPATDSLDADFYENI